MKYQQLRPEIVGPKPNDARDFKVEAIFVRYLHEGTLAITLNMASGHYLILFGNETRALFKAWTNNVTLWPGRMVRVTRRAMSDTEHPDHAAQVSAFSIEPLNTLSDSVGSAGEAQP